MARPIADDDCAFIAGDGEYAIEVVSKSRHQARLEWIGQGRGEEPVDYDCTAVLTYEPDNPHVADAVSVTINGVRVGYLPADAAASMIAAMQAWDFERAACDAIIEGGWYRSADDKGDFSVRLDANPDFTPASIPLAPRLTPVPAPVRSVVRRRNTAYDLVLGAAATAAILFLAGGVWLFVEQRAEAVRLERHALAPSAQQLSSSPPRATDGALGDMETQPNDNSLQAIGARAATVDSAQQTVKLVSAGSARPAPVSIPLEVIGRRRPAPIVEADGNVSRAAAPEPARAIMPVSRDNRTAAAADLPSVDLVDARDVPTPAGGSIERLSPAGIAASVVDEIDPVPSGKALVAIAARTTTAQVEPPAAAAVSSFTPMPAPQPAAPSMVPPKPAPGIEWVKLIPPPRPDLESETEDATESAAAEVRRSRADVNARAAPRRARTRAKARTWTRPRRNERQGVRYRRAASPPPAVPTPGPAAVAMPPAARLFQAWTEDVQAAMEGRRRPR